MVDEKGTREDNNRKSESRANKMIDLFNAVRGQELKKFPVPPFTKWLNGRVIEAARGEVLLEFDIRSEMANPTGLLHGGMQSAILDDTIGMTTATLGYEGFLITINMTVNYLGKVKVGETITSRGKILREGRNIVHAKAQLFDKDKNLIANAHSNLLITSHEPNYAKKLDNFNEA
mgnify:CR=1 FL=1